MGFAGESEEGLHFGEHLVEETSERETVRGLVVGRFVVGVLAVFLVDDGQDFRREKGGQVVAVTWVRAREPENGE